MRRVGVLTGGGDVPGLNAVLRALAWRLTAADVELVGLRRGWASLVHMVPREDPANEEWTMALDRRSTRRIERAGGTVLHSSRLNPGLLLENQVPDGLRDEVEPVETERGIVFDATRYVLRVLEFLELDALVVVGGDGTLSYGRRLHEEGYPVIAVPKTMDNDVYGTDYSIGFSTAITRAVHFINDLRTAAGSHERILVVELFGRYSGEPCLLSSYLASVDRALIAEVPFEEEVLFEKLLQDKAANPSDYAVVTVSEGAHPAGGAALESGHADAVGHRKLGGIGARIVDGLVRATGERAMYQPLGYLMRSGPPDSLDLLVAKNFGNLAGDLLLRGKTGLLAAVVGGRYTAVSIDRLGEGERRVDVERFYDVDEYRPKIESLRGLPMFLH